MFSNSSQNRPEQVLQTDTAEPAKSVEGQSSESESRADTRNASAAEPQKAAQSHRAQHTPDQPTQPPAESIADNKQPPGETSNDVIQMQEQVLDNKQEQFAAEQNKPSEQTESKDLAKQSPEGQNQAPVTEGQTADNQPQQTAEGKESSEQKKADESEKAPEKEKPVSRFDPKPKFRKMEEVRAHIDEYMDFLATQSEYDNTDVLHVLKGIGRIYFDMRSKRQESGELLVQRGFIDHVKKMTQYFNRIGIFKSDTVWFPCYYTLNTVWNFSDVSKDIAKAAHDAGLLHYYLLNMSHKPYLENRSSKNVAYVLKSSLSTLQNIIRLCPESKPTFHDENALAIIEPFLSDDDEFMRALAVLTISAIISEDEAAQMEDKGSIKFIIKCIRLALKNSKRRYRGFSPLELTEGLARIAVNDSNKKKIVDEGALTQLVQLMTGDDEDEQLHASKVIWTLCFDDYSRQKVEEEPECVAMLEKLKQSENKSVKHAASGALWKLRGEEKHQREKTTVGAVQSDKHIFLSYNHDHKDIVHKVKDRLKADGYRVWIDTEQMGGSTLEAMALAVENAYLVLVCASEKYKLSPNCRTEAEYTFQLKRPIVPLMMQRRYKPDGWLGMLMGSKLYINFDGKFEFEHAYQMLLKEMAPYMVTDQTDGAPQVVVPQKAAVVQSAVPGGFSPRPSTSAASMQREYDAASWSKEQVQEWVQKSGFNGVLNDKLLELLNAMDGKLLVAFANLKIKAAEFFCAQLEEKYGADMLQLLHLTHALDALP